MTTPMKTVTPSAAHLAFRKALEAAMQEHAKELQADEILAIMSHAVGQVIALQDQRKYTVTMVLDLVDSNMDRGNQEMVQALLTGQVGGMQ